MTAVRVASWPPWYSPNRYIELFHAALVPHGVEHVPHLPLEAEALARRQVHVSHVHWIEWAWQSRGRSAWRQRRALRALEGFFADTARLGIPVAWTVHNLVAHEGDAAGDDEGFRLVHQHAVLRIFHSDHARTEALRTFGGAGESLVMPLGNYDDVLPPPRARPLVRGEWGVPDGATLLACVGNVRRYKGFDLAIQALEALGRDDVYLVVAGRCRDPRLEGELRTLAAAQRRVRLDFSLIDDQRLADLLHACDAVLLPYREVTGSAALMVAASAGRGVVATDLPYFREVLAQDAEAGVLAAAPTPEAFAAALAGFLDGDMARRGAAARRIADRSRWSDVVAPVAGWFRRHAPG